MFQIKPKWGHKWKSWTRRWGHCPEQCDLPNWLSFSGNGDFWSCQHRWPKGRRFSSFPSPFHDLQGRREFCTELTLHFGIQPTPLALYLWLLLGPLTRDPVAVCKLTVDRSVFSQRELLERQEYLPSKLLQLPGSTLKKRLPLYSWGVPFQGRLKWKQIVCYWWNLSDFFVLTELSKGPSGKSKQDCWW